MTNEQIVNDYYEEMMKGCMCNQPDQDILDGFINQYNGSKDELLADVLQLGVLKNSVKLWQGTFGYPTL